MAEAASDLGGLDRPLVLVGAGRMGSAMLAGWLDQGLPPSQLQVIDPSISDETARLLAEHGLAGFEDATGIAGPAPAVVVLAVKPQVLPDILTGLGGLAGPDTLFLSIAAGIDLATIVSALGTAVAAVRAMPNTPAAIGRGTTVAVANQAVTENQRALATILLQAVGDVGWVEDEALIDAVTALSGSGPAYVFLLAECMAEAGRELGLPADLAMRLARQTVAGAGEMLFQLDEEAAQLRRNVTSPGGTTEAALNVLMADPGLAELMRRAMTAARDRARELGG